MQDSSPKQQAHSALSAQHGHKHDRNVSAVLFLREKKAGGKLTNRQVGAKSVFSIRNKQ